MEYKPTDYNSVSPYLVVDDASAAIAFLQQAFGAQEIRRFPDPSGRVMHAEIRLDDTVVMLADAKPPEWLSFPSSIHVYVPDVDATFRRALAAGATVLQEPVKKEDDDKRGGIKDPWGNSWWIATKVE